MATNIPVFTSWSTTAGSNQPDSTDSAAIVEDLQKIQAEVRKYTATKGADIASATTTDLANATGNYVHITGTTTVEGFGTIAVGVRFLLVFDGALVLTHSATKLILPTGANITTAAGDRCEVVSLGSGNFRVLWYQRADGTPLALDAELSAIAGLTSAANKVPRFTGSGTAEVIDVEYGTYTPTVTAGTNLSDASALADFQYMRVGTMVTVSGHISVDPVSAGAITAYITLPIASNFTSAYDASGTGGVISGILCSIRSDDTDDRLFLTGSSSVTLATTVSVIAQYVIK